MQAGYPHRKRAEALPQRADALRTYAGALPQRADALRKYAGALLQRADALRKHAEALPQRADGFSKLADAFFGSIPKVSKTKPPNRSTLFRHLHLQTHHP